MYIEKTNLWWKMKIYQEVSDFLKHPTKKNLTRLYTALHSYNDFAERHSVNTQNTYDEHEELISA